MSILAVIAVALAAGTWFGIRWAEAQHRIDDMVATVMTTPLPEPSASAAQLQGAADTGDRAEESPRLGAVSTSKHPASAHSPASAARTSGT